MTPLQRDRFMDRVRIAMEKRGSELHAEPLADRLVLTSETSQLELRPGREYLYVTLVPPGRRLTHRI